MFLQPQFAEFGKQVVLFSHITSQLEGVAHDDLLIRKGRSGFPSFVMMDADGGVLAIGGQRTVEGFEATVATAKEMQAVAKKAKAGDAEAQKEIVLKRIGWGAMPFEEAAKAVAELELSGAEKAGVQGQLLTLEINAARLEKDPKKSVKMMLRIQEEGRAPTDPSTLNRFWWTLSRNAETAKDVDAYARYVEYLKTAVEAQPRLATMLSGAEEVLARLRSESK